MDDLREGAAKGVSEALLAEMRRIAQRLSLTRPTPTGASRWSDEEIDDLVFDSICRVGPGAVVLAANEAAGDQQFRSWLGHLIRTSLDLRARETPSGRIIRSVDDALREEPGRFTVEGGRWRLAGDERETEWAEGDAELVRFAWEAETTTVRLSRSVANAPTVGLRRDIRKVAGAVLLHAGPLPKEQLADVLAQRFNVPFASQVGYLDDGFDQAEESQGTDDIAVSKDPVSDHAALWMLDQLTEDERHCLRLVVEGATERSLADALGCTKYKAGLLIDRIKEKLHRLAEEAGDDDQGATARLLDLVGHEGQSRH